MQGMFIQYLAKTKVICTLGPMSRTVEQCEDLLKAGMSVARFNFSHGSHEYHQGTLDNLRQAMRQTRLMCAVMLDTKGPEIRTGMLKDGEPVKLQTGDEVTVTTDYAHKGDAKTIALSYKKLPQDVAPGSQILIADGSIVLEVLSCDVKGGTVRARCLNTATLGERKNCNLPGVVVDLPTLTEKDKVDILEWGVPNDIDFIAASFVRKASDVRQIREILGEHDIKIYCKIENQEGMENYSEILAETDGISECALVCVFRPSIRLIVSDRAASSLLVVSGRPWRSGHGNSPRKGEIVDVI